MNRYAFIMLRYFENENGTVLHSNGIFAFEACKIYLFECTCLKHVRFKCAKINTEKFLTSEPFTYLLIATNNGIFLLSITNKMPK